MKRLFPILCFVCVFFVDVNIAADLPVHNITTGKEYANIQAAVNDANIADVLELKAATYTGPGNRDIDFDGKSITVRSTDPNDWNVVSATTIDCNGTEAAPHRAFIFKSGEDANCIVDGLRIINGRSVFNGGAIHCTVSSPTIRNCIIENSITRGHGAAIYCANGSNMTIHNCIIRNNTFDPTGYGGGIFCYKSSPTITNCIITGNSAVGPGRHGGGINCRGDQDAGANALVANCIVAGNTADHRGGGLYAYWSEPNFVNCTVIGNKSLEGGGIGSFRESHPNVVNCIVRDNRAPDGNQIALISTLRVWSAFYPTEMTVSYSNVEGGQADACIDAGCSLNWQTGNIDTEPNFVDAGHWDDAGTPADANDDFFVIGNYHLLPDSNCVGAGDNSAVPSPADDNDIDGEQRIFNTAVDMGADEVVTNPADFDSNGIVNYADLERLSTEWLDSGSELETDLFDDDFIDFYDYCEFAQRWFWTGGWFE